MAKHQDQDVADGIHIIAGFQFASNAAMVASAGFTNSDVGKVAQVTGDTPNTFHLINEVSTAGLTAGFAEIGATPVDDVVVTGGMASAVLAAIEDDSDITTIDP